MQEAFCKRYGHGYIAKYNVALQHYVIKCKGEIQLRSISA